MLATISPLAGQDKQSVIDRHLQAIGGKERWQTIQTKSDSSLTLSFKPGKLTPDTLLVVTQMMRPNLQKTRFYDRGRLKSILAFDGHVFWTQSGENRKVQSLEEAMYFRSTIMLGLNDLLLEAENLVYKGVQELDKQKFEVLQVKRPGWLLSSLWFFDRESGLLYGSMVEGADVKRITYFKDYRRVSGILWPFVEESRLEGKVTDLATLIKLEFDVAMDRHVFEP